MYPELVDNELQISLSNFGHLTNLQRKQKIAGAELWLHKKDVHLSMA